MALRYNSIFSFSPWSLWEWDKCEILLAIIISIMKKLSDNQVPSSSIFLGSIFTSFTWQSQGCTTLQSADFFCQSKVTWTDQKHDLWRYWAWLDKRNLRWFLTKRLYHWCNYLLRGNFDIPELVCAFTRIYANRIKWQFQCQKRCVRMDSIWQRPAP